MDSGIILDIAREALMTVITVAAPPLAIGLTVGIIVSIFQTVTSIQEPTLAFVPKILGVLLSLLVFGSFMGTTLVNFVQRLFSELPYLIVP
jgi:flagellar biosynthetic protein FliQ